MFNRPLSSGDVCIIINGLGKEKSPNIGKLVTISKRLYGNFGMDHRDFGPIYSCVGKDLYKLSDSGGYIATNTADLPGIWLERIDPPKLIKEVNKILELED